MYVTGSMNTRGAPRHNNNYSLNSNSNSTNDAGAGRSTGWRVRAPRKNCAVEVEAIEDPYYCERLWRTRTLTGPITAAQVCDKRNNQAADDGIHTLTALGKAMFKRMARPGMSFDEYGREWMI